MAYDEDLAGRVDDALAGETGITTRPMFGVLCYLQHGHAFAGVWHDSLILRVGPAGYETALREPHVGEFDITGRPMRGWVVAGAKAIRAESALQAWLQCALTFAATLPKKPRKGRRTS